MTHQRQERWNWDPPEESYPLSSRRPSGQRHRPTQAIDYYPYENPPTPGNVDDYSLLAERTHHPAIHSPPPVRQTPGRPPRGQPRFGSAQWNSPYEALPTNDTSHILPATNEPGTVPQIYAVEPYNTVLTDDNAGSLAPSTNKASFADGVSTSTDPVAPLNVPQQPNANADELRDEQNRMENPYLLEADTFLNRAASKIRIKRAFHWLDPKFFHEQAWFSWSAPHSYQLPGHYYRSQSGGQINIYKHRDVFRRKHAGLNDDRFLDPLDGRVRKLFVQTVSHIYNSENDRTWRRTYIENVSPYIIRLAYWPYSHMPDLTRGFPTHRDAPETSILRMGTWKQEQWIHVGVRWLPACLGLLILMCGPTDIEGQIRNHGCYDPVPYRYWSYPLTARNFHENKPTSPFTVPKDLRIADRCLRPRRLCFLDSCTEENPRGCMDPHAWIDRHGGGVEPTYVFISYTAEKQFERRCPKSTKEIKTKGSSDCACTLCYRSALDAEALHKIARLAAQNAQVTAYWTDQCCMSTKQAELQDDVYRISDVVRGAAKIVVIVGRTGKDDLPASVTTLDLLREWGMRMWTWPEVLLGPAREKIQVYTRDGNAHMPLEVSKMEFPAQVWDDGEVARQLIDNYDNTLTLSRLELVVLALECLKRRVDKGTTKYLDGDLSYALMGLLRQRPKVVPTDSAFQAFARLSLANDSDRLLERMICLLPVDEREGSVSSTQDIGTETGLPTGAHPAQGGQNVDEQRKRHYWTNMNDHWGAKLWDIEPLCQVAGIGKDDTVVLDGAYAATVHWNKFERVSITTRETWARALARYFVRGTPGWFFIGVLTLVLSTNNPPAKGVGAFFIIISLVTVLLSPMLILHIYGGKLWNTQPWLFGFEGYMDLRKIEMKIFGFPSDRLSWAPYGSTMSHHTMNDRFLDEECEGTDPLLGANDRQGAEISLTGEKMRLFTLVDTNTMTVTTFRAVRPPVVALLCGSEGGMQRALMCSYDWTSQTLWRETVLRLPTPVLEKMPRIGRVRFGLRRWETETERNQLRPPV